VPLLLWLSAVVIIFGVSYKQLSGLQGPLASLDNAAHVLYRVARTRAYANQLAMADAASENEKYRELLSRQVELLSQEYSTLMYGGHMLTQVGPKCHVLSSQQTLPPIQWAVSVTCRC
jgi:hypothetical protein